LVPIYRAIPSRQLVPIYRFRPAKIPSNDPKTIIHITVNIVSATGWFLFTAPNRPVRWFLFTAQPNSSSVPINHARPASDRFLFTAERGRKLVPIYRAVRSEVVPVYHAASPARFWFLFTARAPCRSRALTRPTSSSVPIYRAIATSMPSNDRPKTIIHATVNIVSATDWFLFTASARPESRVVNIVSASG
jgi:hypothetical protein